LWEIFAVHCGGHTFGAVVHAFLRGAGGNLERMSQREATSPRNLRRGSNIVTNKEKRKEDGDVEPPVTNMPVCWHSQRGGHQLKD
jgi:hypothetical protein